MDDDDDGDGDDGDGGDDDDDDDGDADDDDDDGDGDADDDDDGDGDRDDDDDDDDDEINEDIGNEDRMHIYKSKIPTLLAFKALTCFSCFFASSWAQSENISCFKFISYTNW